MKKDKSMPQEPGLMTVDEIAQYLKINVYTAYRMAERGELPAVKLGRIWRFKKDDIYRWLADKMTREQKERFITWQKKYDKLMKEKP